MLDNINKFLLTFMVIFIEGLYVSNAYGNFAFELIYLQFTSK